jgi:hypothetical protein
MKTASLASPFRSALLLALTCPTLAACGAAIVPQVQPPAAGFTPASKPLPTGVMGADARGLIRLFGEPRLDIRDPAARKLQFANTKCVLDAYLYPPSANREPLVTHVDARTGAGADMDWQACAKLLRGD